MIYTSEFIHSILIKMKIKKIDMKNDRWMVFDSIHSYNYLFVIRRFIQHL
jgi:hypothetical protein